MKIKIFKIRLNKKYLELDQNIVNEFKENVKVKNHDIQLVLGKVKYLVVVYHYVDKIDYVSDLSEQQQILFETLKKWRTTKYLEEGIQPYMVMMDKVIHSIVKMNPSNLKELRKVNGIGEKKVEKYGEDILSILYN